MGFVGLHYDGDVASLREDGLEVGNEVGYFHFDSSSWVEEKAAGVRRPPRLGAPAGSLLRQTRHTRAVVPFERTVYFPVPNTFAAAAVTVP